MDHELVKEVVGRIKSTEAPRLDAVPSVVVACVMKSDQADLMEMIKDTLRRGTIPPSWKRARLVLITKPGKDPITPTTYRPISVLPALSKVCKYALKAVIERQTGGDPFQPTQFGFRRGTGTVEATLEVTRFAEECSRKNRLCVMVATDVQNAFNTLRWAFVLDELAKRGVSSSVSAVLRDNFTDRWVTVHTPHAQVHAKITAGVPQGSVLGPFLWNIVYDGVLKPLDIDRFTQAIAYADYLAILFSARDACQLEEKMAATMAKAQRWFAKSGPCLADNKTEVIILTGKEWQASWEAFDPKNWTRRLVGSVGTFLDKAGMVFQLDYRTTHILTSHGSFSGFRKKIGKSCSEACADCGAPKDNAEHILTACSTYEEERRSLTGALGAPVEVATMLGLATKTEENWSHLRIFAQAVMSDRCQTEIAKEKEAREERIRVVREAAARRALEIKRKGRNRKVNQAGGAKNARPSKIRRVAPSAPLYGYRTPA